MTTAEDLRALVSEQPKITKAQAAAQLGVTRQHISQLASTLGLKMVDGRTLRASTRDRQWKNQWGGTGSLSSNFVGGAGELTAAADMLRRGIPVYRSCTAVSSFDLVADVDGVLFRVEVRCAKLRGGRLAFLAPAKGRYDVLALVDQNGAVTYRPNAGIEWPE